MKITMGKRKQSLLFVLLGIALCYMTFRLVYVTIEIDNIRKKTRLRNCPFPIDVSFIKREFIAREQTNTSNDKIVRFPEKYKFSPFFTEFSGIDCKAVIEGDTVEKKKAYNLPKIINYKAKSDQYLIDATQDCTRFRKSHGYDVIPVNREEREFPIAYSILFYQQVVQVNLLLRAIYRPQNVYCLHVDGNARTTVHDAAKSLANCFENVFLVSKREKITYAGFSRLQADLNCMDDLLHRESQTSWKYFINIPSQEYPLKTNAEIVKILKIYNGANDIEGITGHRMLHYRFKYKFTYVMTNGQNRIVKTDVLKEPPPHNITVIKGSAYGVFSRAFVDFILHDQRSKDLLEWSKDIMSPDEYYWATLHHNPGLQAPGSYAGPPDKKPWLATYAGWGGVDSCAGKFVRGVCVFGPGDLPLLITKKELFANKFYIDYQPVTLHCLEEWLLNKTMSNLPFDGLYYRQLPFVRKNT